MKFSLNLIKNKVCVHNFNFNFKKKEDIRNECNVNERYICKIVSKLHKLQFYIISRWVIYACKSSDLLSFIIQKLISNKNCPNSNPASCISREEKKKYCMKKQNHDCNLLKYDELLLISTNKKMNREIFVSFLSSSFERSHLQNYWW